MKHLSVLIKPASASCNLRCQYCFYGDVSNLREVRSFGIMTSAVMEAMIDNIYHDLQSGDRMTFAFQGGEPTLAGLSYFKHFVTYVKTKNPLVDVHYTLQTNGTTLDEAWCSFLKEHHFLIGLSIDGGLKFHDQNRLDHKGEGTYQRVMAARTLLDRYQIDYNVLCVLTNQVARHPQKIFNFLLKEKIRHVQFIPCLDDLNPTEASPYALQPERFASFYKQLYRLWESEFKRGNYISIQLFDHLVNLLSHGRVGTCGMLGQCQAQYIVEADGSVYPCDFYVLDQFYLGHLTEKTLKELFSVSEMNDFLAYEKKETSAYCKRCSYFKMCRGGCKRMKHAMYLNKEETYCGYEDFLKTHYPSLDNLARRNRH